MENRSTKPPDELLSCSRNIVDKRLKPPAEQPQKCPRCESTNTKFCYYNNYSLSQPRYFCKTCRRYWTKGGTLRNVPVGGGCRKNKRTKRSVDQPSSNDHQESSPQGANQSHSTSSDQPARSIYGYELEGDGGGEQQLGSFVGGFTRGLGPGSIGSSLPPLGGLSLQSLKSTFPGIDLQNTQSGPLNMVDLSCIFDAQHQQQLNSSEGITPLNIPVEAYNSIDQQWQRLLQQQRAGLPMDDGQGSMMHLESLRDDSMRPGKTRDEEENGSIRGRGPPPTQWQMNHEGFFETPAPTDGNNNAPPPFWNHGGTTSWPDVSGFGPSTSSNPLL